MLKIKKPPAPRRGAGRLFANFLVNYGKSGFWRHENINPTPLKLSAQLKRATRELKTLSLVATMLTYIIYG
jgi:hypothetical protein